MSLASGTFLVFLAATVLLFPRTSAATFSVPSYSDVLKQLSAWESEFPDYVEVWDAQTQYGLSSAGTCIVDGTTQPCKQWFIRVTNEKTLLNELDRPHVFYSGNLHGNEQVGPPVLVELINRMLDATRDANKAGPKAYKPESSTAWFSRLVDTRVTVFLIVSNPIGHEQRVRHEVGLDPNRDFAHDVPPGACMNTIVARAVNEVFRAHLFQAGIT